MFSFIEEKLLLRTSLDVFPNPAGYCSVINIGRFSLLKKKEFFGYLI